MISSNDNSSTTSIKNPVGHQLFGEKMNHWNFTFNQKEFYILECQTCLNKERFKAMPYRNQLIWVCEHCGNQTKFNGLSIKNSLPISTLN